MQSRLTNLISATGNDTTATSGREDQSDDASCRKELTSLYGGQAIIEGVMMKGPERTVAACRAPDGRIVHTIMREGADESRKNFWYKTPFLRGFLILIDSMSLGYKALLFSGEISDPDGGPRNPFLENLMIVISLVFALMIFKFLPILVTTLILGYNLKEIEEVTVGSSVSFSAIEGLIKAMVLVGYILSIRQLKDVRRVFQYHGAEHKTINAYEGGEDLKVESIEPYPTFHARCGTSFLFAVVLFSLMMAMCFPLITWWLFDDPGLAIPGQTGFFSMNLLWRLILHITFLPVISSIGYEFIRFTARFNAKSPGMIILTYPGKMFQTITALEPDRDMLEVALTSMRLAMGIKLPEGSSIDFKDYEPEPNDPVVEDSTPEVKS